MFLRISTYSPGVEGLDGAIRSLHGVTQEVKALPGIRWCAVFRDAERESVWLVTTWESEEAWMSVQTSLEAAIGNHVSGPMASEHSQTFLLDEV